MLSLNSLKKMYYDSPLWMKKLYASIPYEIRNGKEYREYKKFLETNIDVEAYEIMKLKETLLYAYENTTYYKKVFDRLSVKPYEINSREDIKSFPIIDKNTVRRNFDDMTVRKYNKKDTFYVASGGSTGAPMKFLQSKNMWSKELAYDTVYFERFGYSPMMSRASFRGGEFGKSKDNIYWNSNPMYNEVHFSPFHLTLSTVDYYVNELNKLNPKMYLSYPSSLLNLIDCMDEKNLVLDDHPKVILLISENINALEVKRITHYFNRSKVISFYGHSERLIFGISSDSLLNQYKIDRRYGLFELIDDSNMNVQGNNIHGEVTGTSFDNWTMPLIRYKTGDHTTFVDKNEYITSKIDGRWNHEYFVGYNGGKFFLSALNTHSDAFDNIRQFQYKQIEKGKVELLIVPGKDFSSNDKTLILGELQKKVGDNIFFSIKIIDRLELTPRGKVKKIIKGNI